MSLICLEARSKPLHALRALLVEKLADAGVQFKNTFPDSFPHVTLAYQEAGESFEPFDLPIPLKLTVTSVRSLFGEHGDVQQTPVVFPLKRSRKEASRRVVRRWLAHQLGMPTHSIYGLGLDPR